MEHFYSSYFYDFDSAISIYLSEIYDVVQHYELLIFNNCPLYYQIIYGYAPITYLLIRRKYRKNNYKNYFDKSSLNWLFLNFKLLIFRANKLIILINFIKIFFLKFYYYFKYKLETGNFYKWFFLLNSLKNFFKRIVWKPTFKKYSYFGLFSLIRTKWFK